MESPRLMVNWYIGTMGFSYSDWNGVFYPSEMNERNYLGYYSRIFNCVELDSTFYGTPRVEVVQRWAASTPQDFRFCLKMPRAITHDASLVGVTDMLREFLATVRHLQEKLGVILIQLPPSFAASRIEVLERFIQLLPADLRFAVEIRHQSWYTGTSEQHGEKELPALAQMLAKYQVAWAATEYPNLPGEIYPITSFAYIRWIGQHGTFQQHYRERIDRQQNLIHWWQYIQTRLETVSEIYGMFNNDYAGFAARTANRFKEIAGLPVIPFKPPVQPTLF
jgi:uncharacterized protein YecE (DUF72 family)